MTIHYSLDACEFLTRYLFAYFSQITALERARKIDELQARVLCLENEKTRLMSQLTAYKTRARSAVESSNDRKLRDEAIMNVSIKKLFN